MIAGDTQGNVFASYPLKPDGSNVFSLFGDPYKGTVVKEDGSEVEEDIYEAYNLSLLVTGQKGSIAPGHGVRINGEKLMHTSSLKGNTYKAKIGDDSHNVTIDEIFVLKKGKVGVMLAVKGQVRNARRRRRLAANALRLLLPLLLTLDAVAARARPLPLRSHAPLHFRLAPARLYPLRSTSSSGAWTRRSPSRLPRAAARRLPLDSSESFAGPRARWKVRC